MLRGVAGFALLVLATGAISSAIAAPAGQSAAESDSAYLLAHMTKERYGILYYSISLDGLHWTQVNGGRPVSADYHGHASIAQGGDGRYYLVGNKSDDDPEIRFWVSDDLVNWKSFGTYRPNLRKAVGQPHALQRIGAPKLYYDKPSKQFLLTWHTPNVPGSDEDPERYWASQRTLYVVSKDLVRFDKQPRRLFSWDMATIDTIVQPNPEGGYCAIIKDERYPSYNWTTGKTIRISCAPDMLGPYPEPGPPLSPNFREAPTIIRAPNGADWYLYYEQYAGTSYGLSMAPRLEGPWYQVSGNSGVPEWNRYEMPAGLRHGSMIAISRKQYDAILAAFPNR
ncbi:glycosyl hydrolase family 43 [Sphingomonas cavernae]|uniref:Glycosyl hydrolase family 43 n=1 Tax=Sphingomonas cavernae TaxID=2320861 RepID=A0A418WKR6_9SPHN|nr:glycosyl hydrolase family 43 [Sphingomonas cavernae]RJF90636.1 glycosyl hydrolase family 43 [Sphingomonas cavernae]